jgi:parvulin-like peptidyl-prolyl isomerase
MGKGNREKLRKTQQLAESSASMGLYAPKKRKKQTPTWVWTLTVVLILALLVVLVVLSALSDSGYFLRWTTVARSENYSINGTTLSYYFYSNYNIFGNYAKYLGLDTSKSLKLQEYDKEKSTTWFDYFMDMTLEQLKTMLVYCEEAHARGIKLDDEDYKLIDENIETLKTKAAEEGYPVHTFTALMYGPGVKIKDIRRALELSQLAAKCAEIIEEEISDGVTDEDVDAYYEEHKTDFWTADFLSYTFSASKVSDDPSYDFEAEKAKVGKYANELFACTTEEAFRRYVAEYEADTYFDNLYEKKSEEYSEDVLPDEAELATRKAAVVADAVEKALAGESVELPDSSETLDKIFNSIETELVSYLDTKLENLKKEKYAYSDPTAEGASDEVKWVCDSSRATGDMTKIEKSDDNGFSVTVNYMLSPMSRDEQITRNVGHILFKYDNHDDPEAEAERVLDLYKSGEMTKEAFEALADEYNEDSNNFYTDVVRGQMVEEFEEWLFDESRKVGDVGIVETEYGYHIMYYDGEGKPTWYVSVKNEIITERTESWVAEKTEQYGVDINENAANKIKA